MRKKFRKQQRVIYVRENKQLGCFSGCLIIFALLGALGTAALGLLFWPLWILTICFIMIAILFSK